MTEPPHVLAVDDSIVDRAVISTLQAPPQLQIPSYDGGQWQESVGGSQPGPQCAHDHHGLLHAGDERLRPPEAGQGVGGAAGDPGGDHAVGELAYEDPAVSGGGRRGLPHQAGAGVGCVAPLQPPHPLIQCDTTDQLEQVQT